MSEVNVFLSAIHAAVQTAIAAAVAEATKPLIERIAALESTANANNFTVGGLEARITALENNPAIGTDTVLEQRIVALETKLTEAKLFEQTTEVTVPIDEARMVEALNSQEWFWEKLDGRIERYVDSAVEEALDQHCVSYDHENYDSMYEEWGGESASDFMKDGDMGERVREHVEEALNNATFSVSI